MIFVAVLFKLGEQRSLIHVEAELSEAVIQKKLCRLGKWGCNPGSTRANLGDNVDGETAGFGLAQS